MAQVRTRPGFTNRKPKHRNAQGLYPFARLSSQSGQPFPAATAFHATLVDLHQAAERYRASARLRFAAHPTRYAAPASLARFGASLIYTGRPATADMAFSMAACSQGWTASDIAAALAFAYLSRDANKARQNAYIRRTVSEALRWAPA